jgi:hypothetical protein
VVTVNPRPFVNDDVDETCSNVAFEFEATHGDGTNIVPVGTQYTWTIKMDNTLIEGQSAQSVAQDKVSQILRNTTTSNQDLVYEVTPILGSCVGPVFELTVTVTPTPEIGDKDDAICSGESFEVDPALLSEVGDIIPAGTRYTWTVVPNADVDGESDQITSQETISQELTNRTNTAKEVIYTVTPVLGSGCAGKEFEVTITVNPTPEIDDKEDVICSGAAFTVTPANVPGGDIVPAGTTYTWAIKLVDPGISGATGSTAPGLTSISQTLTNNTHVVQKVVYTVTPTSGAAGACVGDDFEIEVTVNPTPVIGVKTAPEICSNDLFEFEPVNVTGGDIVPLGTTYTWTVAANADVEGQSAQTTIAQPKISQTLRNLTNTPKTLVYTVTPLVGTCAGDSFEVSVTINPTPEIAKKEAEICSEDPFEVDPLTLAELGDIIPANTTYTWTVASNTNVTGQIAVSARQTKISQTLTNLTNEIQTVIYTVTPYSEAVDGCEGEDFEIEVTVNPRPFVNDDVAETCSNVAFEFVATHGKGTNIVPVGTQYTWTIKTDNTDLTGQSAQAIPQDKVSQELRNLTISNQDLVYEVTPILGGCVGPKFELRVTVTPTPEIGDKVDEICSGESFEVDPVSLAEVGDIIPAGTRYIWTVVPNDDVDGESNQTVSQAKILQELTNKTNTPKNVIFTVTPVLGTGGCAGEDFEVTITVNPTPVIADKEEIIC